LLRTISFNFISVYWKVLGQNRQEKCYNNWRYHTRKLFSRVCSNLL